MPATSKTFTPSIVSLGCDSVKTSASTKTTTSTISDHHEASQSSSSLNAWPPPSCSHCGWRGCHKPGCPF
ncbi:hypothetical protein B0H34DRAFT_692655 [Crassisporium funariophilum]|nr:hypothetical protein B0H34DRAFT_692655 [Crassisporium funariophilum]